jgi:hypothetical protein
MIYLFIFMAVSGIAFAGWKITNRNAYESAEYQIVAQEPPLKFASIPH